MANFTKIAIRETFLQLLEEKPFKEISVRDIVDRCGVNRNTFYYHYRDIPDLLETIVKEDTDALIRQSTNIESIEECLNAIIGFILSRRKSVLHIYRSVNRDISEQYLWRLCNYAATTYFGSVTKERGISEKDSEILITYIKCITFGIITGWLENGMKDDMYAFAKRLGELKQGELKEMIGRCETV